MSSYAYQPTGYVCAVRTNFLMALHCIGQNGFVVVGLFIHLNGPTCPFIFYFHIFFQFCIAAAVVVLMIGYGRVFGWVRSLHIDLIALFIIDDHNQPLSPPLSSQWSVKFRVTRSIVEYKIVDLCGKSFFDATQELSPRKLSMANDLSVARVVSFLLHFHSPPPRFLASHCSAETITCFPACSTHRAHHMHRDFIVLAKCGCCWWFCLAHDQNRVLFGRFCWLVL